jgi:hypothetical protein
MKPLPDPLDTSNPYPAWIENVFLIKKKICYNRKCVIWPGIFNNLPYP